MRPKNISNVFLKTLPLLLYLFFIQYEVTRSASHRSYINSINAKNRRIKKCIQWSDVNKRIGDYQFRRMFRMTRPCFNRLCQHIIAYTGEKAFKSEAYINA